MLVSSCRSLAAQTLGFGKFQSQGLSSELPVPHRQEGDDDDDDDATRWGLGRGDGGWEGLRCNVGEIPRRGPDTSSRQLGLDSVTALSPPPPSCPYPRSGCGCCLVSKSRLTPGLFFSCLWLPKCEKVA